MKWFGIVEGYTAMALSLLGPSLEELFISNNRKFTPGTVSIIADQMVSLTAINCMAFHDRPGSYLLLNTSIPVALFIGT
jgi:hypothetical protein